MSQQTHLEHIEVSQASASMPTQYPEDELLTIDLKAWEYAETPSRAGKASTKQRQTPGATGRGEGERPPQGFFAKHFEGREWSNRSKEIYEAVTAVGPI